MTKVAEPLVIVADSEVADASEPFHRPNLRRISTSIFSNFP
jgi:hypothetical protein